MIPTFNTLPFPILQLSLSSVLKCGQSFRWSAYSLPEDAFEYRFCLRDRVVCLRQTPENILYQTVLPDPQPDATQRKLREAETLLWLKDYFQLDIDLALLYDEWGSRDKVFSGIKDRFSGIRMLRQDPWENLISTCARNTSPPLLSITLPDGSGVEQTYYPFPTPSALAKPDVSARLRSLGFGYRADFIHRTAKMLVETHGATAHPRELEPSELWLRTLRDMSTEDARIGAAQTAVVPVDTHVHQIAIKHYGMKGSGKGKTNMTPKLYEELSAKFVQVWGPYAGWAHSVLFTSDLKSFALHGLPELSPPQESPKKRSRGGDLGISLPTPPSTPLSSGTLAATEFQSSAERVKKRARILRV
ncbi:hypothetical protein BT96DRAFT_953445 [Gymnopus androsaceus JB14]|uniref:DNA-(apurinic or apyrimidinic site) lyase n=1 Tax=Gymnopus androsaceus JB14 TaxID=1447944 RepID=A0A6A4IMA7_9AGAR|nr:hypothetical protein BT96DRAFT_953445 [Gymnopus androsaceus JB14]